MRREDVALPADGTELGTEVDVVPPSAEPNVVPPRSEQPASSLVVPTVDAAEPPQ